MAFQFKYQVGGVLKETTGLVPLSRVEAPWDADLTEAGGNLIIQWGLGEAVELFVWRFVDARWILMFIDCGQGCLIEVIGWPAYLDALSRYAPLIALSRTEMMLVELRKLVPQ